MALIYTINVDGKVVYNEVVYPFEPPTHRMVGTERVDLNDEEKNEIVNEWILEFIRIQLELEQNNESS